MILCIFLGLLINVFSFCLGLFLLGGSKFSKVGLQCLAYGSLCGFMFTFMMGLFQVYAWKRLRQNLTSVVLMFIILMPNLIFSGAFLQLSWSNSRPMFRFKSMVSNEPLSGLKLLLVGGYNKNSSSYWAYSFIVKDRGFAQILKEKKCKLVSKSGAYRNQAEVDILDRIGSKLNLKNYDYYQGLINNKKIRLLRYGEISYCLYDKEN